MNIAGKHKGLTDCSYSWKTLLRLQSEANDFLLGQRTRGTEWEAEAQRWRVEASLGCA